MPALRRAAPRAGHMGAGNREARSRTKCRAGRRNAVSRTGVGPDPTGLSTCSATRYRSEICTRGIEAQIRSFSATFTDTTAARYPAAGKRV